MTAPEMTAPASGAKVRMYRQGLGDCFLLAFPPDRGARPRFVLIDCGVLLGTPRAKEMMRRVVEHIAKATGGRIDLLVATHEHWDHLSGFDQARELFDALAIGEVWVAWTEDPEDEVARDLGQQRAVALRALHAAVRRLRANGDEDSRQSAAELAPLLGFFGDLGLDGQATGIRGAMDYVVGRGKPPRYRTPGEDPLPLPGVPGARVYVLGPPKEKEYLRRSNPRAGEAYEARLTLDEATAFAAAVLRAHEKAGALTMSPDEKALAELSFPFERAFRVPLAEAQRDRFFRDLYYGKRSAAEPSWRSIEADWLGAASALALKLDSDTNNTSLALAIELIPSGKVLLFPGDAQAGNWRSWHALQWPREEDPDNPVTAAELLGRTVLYKVGHHASHNATLRGQGLELMTHPELVAVIPVDEEMAHKPKGGSPKGWDMPFPPLLKALQERTDGRVIRVDKGMPSKPKKVPAAEWKRFEQRCIEHELYVEITVDE